MKPENHSLTERIIDNRYQVERKLGEGGMGEVYLARDQKTGGQVVLKTPRTGMLIDDPGLKDRFMREIRVMSRLDHPNIVKVFDVSEYEGRPIAAMQYLGGGTLETRSSVPLDRWLPQIADALDYLHAKRLVHRDVKPANVFFHTNDTPCLGDFGVVKPLEGSATMFSLLHSPTEGFTLGTPKYMSPESVEGKEVDGRADQYSLAIVVYERLAGRTPFDADTPAHIFAAHLMTPPPMLSEINDRFGAETSAILNRALAKQRGERFATCTEFADSLLKSLATSTPRPCAEPVKNENTQGSLAKPEREVDSPPPGPPATKRDDPSRRRLAIGAGIAAAALLFAMVLYVGSRPSQPTGATTVLAGDAGPAKPTPAVTMPEPQKANLPASNPVTQPAVSPQPTTPPIRATFVVREGSPDGPLVEGAIIRVIYSSGDGGSQAELNKGTSAASGCVAIDIPADLTKSDQGKYEAVVSNGSGEPRTTTLAGFPITTQFTICAPVRPPEKLIHVTLEMEGDHKLAVVPFFSVGVNIVNGVGSGVAPPAGRESLSGFPSRLEIEALPGSVLGVMTDNGATLGNVLVAFIPLLPGDAGMTLHLRPDIVCLYRDDVPSFVDIAGPYDRVRKLNEQIEEAKANPNASEMLRTKEDELKTFQLEMSSALERLAKHDPRLKSLFERETSKWNLLEAICDLKLKNHLGVMLPIAESGTEARLRFLRGSGADIFFFGGDMAARKKLGKSFVEALRAVQPRCTVLDVRALTDLEGRFDSLEALGLVVDKGEMVPDLSKLPNVRHLLIARDQKKSAVDARSLLGLPKLQSLTLLAGTVRNADSLKACQNLQFLTMPFDDPSVLSQLPRLQYIGGTFPSDTDFSFVQRLPYLKTLAITNLDRQHSLAQLVKASRLKCLALDGETPAGTAKFEDIQGYPNVVKFVEERPDVKVVPYQGLCLGSFWILVVAVSASCAAGVIRWRREAFLRSRGSAQR